MSRKKSVTDKKSVCTRKITRLIIVINLLKRAYIFDSNSKFKGLQAYFLVKRFFMSTYDSSSYSLANIVLKLLKFMVERWIVSFVTAWKVSKYRFFSGPSFPTVRMPENTDHKKLRIWILFTQCVWYYIIIIKVRSYENFICDY